MDNKCKITFAICTVLLMVSIAKANADPIHDIARAREIVAWIYENIEYVKSKDEIKAPDDTQNNGGDCADMSALMLWRLHSEGIRGEMLLLDLDDFEAHHAVVKLYGRIYDPTTGQEYMRRLPLPHKVTAIVSCDNLLADWDQ